MLVLSRRLGEEIVINDNITIRVVDIDRGKVQLGITAPRDMPVHRREIWEEINRDRNSNATTDNTASDGNGK